MQSAALTKQLVPRCRTLAVGPGASAGGRGRAGAAEAEAAGQHRPRTTAAQPETGRQERLQLSRAAAARQPVARRWTRPAVAGVAAAGAAVEHVAEDVAAGSLRPRRLRRPQRLSRPPAVQQPSLQQHRLVGMEGRGPQRSWCLGMRTGDRIVTAPLVSELSWAGLSSIELPESAGGIKRLVRAVCDPEQPVHRRMTVAGALRTAISQPENSQVVVLCADFVLENLGQALCNESDVPFRELIVRTLSCVCVACSTNTPDRFFAWFSRQLLLQHALENMDSLQSVMSQSLSQAPAASLAPCIPHLVRDIVTFLRAQTTFPESVPSTIALLCEIQRLYPAEFAPAFLDVVDVLMSWFLNPMLPHKPLECILECMSSQPFGAAWREHVGFLQRVLSDLVRAALEKAAQLQALPPASAPSTLHAGLELDVLLSARFLAAVVAGLEGDRALELVLPATARDLLQHLVAALDYPLTFHCVPARWHADINRLVLCLARHLHDSCGPGHDDARPPEASDAALPPTFLPILLRQLQPELPTSALCAWLSLMSAALQQAGPVQAGHRDLAAALLQRDSVFLSLRSHCDHRIPSAALALVCQLVSLAASDHALTSIIYTHLARDLKQQRALLEASAGSNNAAAALGFDLVALRHLGRSARAHLHAHNLPLVPLLAADPAVWTEAAVRKHPALAYAALQTLAFAAASSSSSPSSSTTPMSATNVTCISPDLADSDLVLCLAAAVSALECPDLDSEATSLALQFSGALVTAANSRQGAVSSLLLHRLARSLSRLAARTSPPPPPVVRLATAGCLRALAATQQLSSEHWTTILAVCTEHMHDFDPQVGMFFVDALAALPPVVLATYAPRIGPPPPTTSMETQRIVLDAARNLEFRGYQFAQVTAAMLPPSNSPSSNSSSNPSSSSQPLAWLLRLAHMASASTGSSTSSSAALPSTAADGSVAGLSGLSAALSMSFEKAMAWAHAQCAGFAVLARLKTPLGAPMQTLESLNSALKAAAMQSRQDLGENAAATPSGNTNLAASCPPLLAQAAEQRRAVLWLIRFVTILETHVFNAYAGTSSLPLPPRHCLSFFRSNRKVCRSRLAAMKAPLLMAATAAGSPTAVVHHGLGRLADLMTLLKASTSTQDLQRNACQFERTLILVSSAMLQLHLPTQLAGIASWARNKVNSIPLWVSSADEQQPFAESRGAAPSAGQSEGGLPPTSTLLASKPEWMPWLDPLILQAEGRLEAAVTGYRQVLEQLLPAAPKEAQTPTAPPAVDLAVVEFVANEGLRCCVLLGDWALYDTYVQRLENLRSLHSAHAGLTMALTPRRDYDAVHIRALQAIDAQCTSNNSVSAPATAAEMAPLSWEEVLPAGSKLSARHGPTSAVDGGLQLLMPQRWDLGWSVRKAEQLEAAVLLGRWSPQPQTSKLDAVVGYAQTSLRQALALGVSESAHMTAGLSLQLRRLEVLHSKTTSNFTPSQALQPIYTALQGLDEEGADQLDGVDLAPWIGLVRTCDLLTKLAPDVDEVAAVAGAVHLAVARLARKSQNFATARRLLASAPPAPPSYSLFRAFEAAKLDFAQGARASATHALAVLCNDIYVQQLQSKHDEKDTGSFSPALAYQAPSLLMAGKRSAQGAVGARMLLRLAQWLQTEDDAMLQALAGSTELPLFGLQQQAAPAARSAATTADTAMQTELLAAACLRAATELFPTHAEARLAYASWCYRQGRRAFDALARETVAAGEQVEAVEMLFRDMHVGEDSLLESQATYTAGVGSAADGCGEGSTSEGEPDALNRAEIRARLRAVCRSADPAVLDRLMEAWLSSHSQLMRLHRLAAEEYFVYLRTASDGPSAHDGSPTASADADGGSCPPSRGTAGQPAGQPGLSSAAITVTLRLLRLLVKHGPELADVLVPGFQQTPTAAWEAIVPQLLSRLNHPSLLVQDTVRGLICRIAAAAPHRIVYPAVVGGESNGHGAVPEAAHVTSTAAQSTGDVRGDADSGFGRILQALFEHSPDMVAQVRKLVRELKRITVLWEEVWHTLLQQRRGDVRRRLQRLDAEAQRVEENSDLSDDEKWSLMLEKHTAIMRPVVVDLEAMRLQTFGKELQTPHEQWFATTFGGSIEHALAVLTAPSQRPYQAEQTWAPFERVHAELTAHLSQRSSMILRLQDISPGLAAISGSSVSMPGVSTKDRDAALVTIASFGSQVAILPTKTKPKKLSLLGSDGRRYTYLFKGHDDLHLDERIMQFLRVTNAMIGQGGQGGFRARTYNVIPLGPRSGLIQWVDGASPVFSLYKRWQQREVELHALDQQSSAEGASDAPPASSAAGSSSANNHSSKSNDNNQSSRGSRAGPHAQRPSERFFAKITPLLKARGITNVTARASWPLDVLRQVLLELAQETPSNILSRELWASSSTSAEFLAMQSGFVQSLAVMSMIGYVLGLGDRHLDNMLLDLSSGEIVHIDYNICFEKGAKLRVPERVPFRLTQNFRHALGLAGVEGEFRACCEAAMRLLRSNRESLLMLLETFVYDPLVDWALDRKGDRERRAMERNISASLLSSRISELRVQLQLSRESLLQLIPEFQEQLEAVVTLDRAASHLAEQLLDLEEEQLGLRELTSSASVQMLEQRAVLGAREAQCSQERDHQAAALSRLAVDINAWHEQHMAVLDALHSRQLRLEELQSALDEDSVRAAAPPPPPPLAALGQGGVETGSARSALAEHHAAFEAMQPVMAQHQQSLRACIRLLSTYRTMGAEYPRDIARLSVSFLWREWLQQALFEQSTSTCHFILSQAERLDVLRTPLAASSSPLGGAGLEAMIQTVDRRQCCDIERQLDEVLLAALVEEKQELEYQREQRDANGQSAEALRSAAGQGWQGIVHAATRSSPPTVAAAVLAAWQETLVAVRRIEASAGRDQRQCEGGPRRQRLRSGGSSSNSSKDRQPAPASSVDDDGSQARSRRGSASSTGRGGGGGDEDGRGATTSSPPPTAAAASRTASAAAAASVAASLADVNVTSQRSWPLLELWLLSEEHAEVLELLPGLFDKTGTSQHGLAQALRANAGVLKHLIDLVHETQTFVIPEAVKLVEMDEQGCFRVLERIDPLVREVSELLPLVHGCNGVVGARQRYAQRLHHISNQWQALLAGAAAQPGLTLVAGFDGMFGRIEASLDELHQQAAAVTQPLSWAGICCAVGPKPWRTPDSRAEQASVKSDEPTEEATGAEAGGAAGESESEAVAWGRDLFFLKRLQAVHWLLRLCLDFGRAWREGAVRPRPDQRDDEGFAAALGVLQGQGASRVYTYARDFFKVRLQLSTSRLLEVAMSHMLVRLGLDPQRAAADHWVGAEEQPSLDQLHQDAWAEALRAGRVRREEQAGLLMQYRDWHRQHQRAAWARVAEVQLGNCQTLATWAQLQLARYQWVHYDALAESSSSSGTEAGAGAGRMLTPTLLQVVRELARHIQAVMALQMRQSACEQRCRAAEDQLALLAGQTLDRAELEVRRRAAQQCMQLSSVVVGIGNAVVHLELFRLATPETAQFVQDVRTKLQSWQQLLQISEQLAEQRAALELQLPEAVRDRLPPDANRAWVEDRLNTGVVHELAAAVDEQKRVLAQLPERRVQLQDVAGRLREASRDNALLQQELEPLLVAVAKGGDRAAQQASECAQRFQSTLDSLMADADRLLAAARPSAEEEEEEAGEMDDQLASADLPAQLVQLHDLLAALREGSGDGDDEVAGGEAGREAAGEAAGEADGAEGEEAMAAEHPQASRLYKPAARQETNAHAVAVWRRVRAKLEGRDGALAIVPTSADSGGGAGMRSSSKLSVEQQVDRAIREAVSTSNLAQMFEGWTAWI